MSPERIRNTPAAQLRAAQEAVRDARESGADVLDAWELLATRGLIPMAWLDDPQRSFVGRRWVRMDAEPSPRELAADRSRMEPDYVALPRLNASARIDTLGARKLLPGVVHDWIANRPPAHRLQSGTVYHAIDDGSVFICVDARTAHPQTHEECASFASDVAGVVEVEALARELVTITTLDATGAVSVMWRFGFATAVNPRLRARSSIHACNEPLARITELGYLVDVVGPTHVQLACPSLSQRTDITSGS